MGNMVKGKGVSILQANVHVIHDPMFPLYVIRGKRNILIDCSILAKAHELATKLDKLLGKEKVHTVLLTHSHYDHTGACSYLQDKYGFDIVASKRTKEILENDKAVEFIDDLNQKFKAILNDRSESVFSKPARIRAVSENETIEVSDGQVIEVLETPGHTRCSLSFLLKPDHILFPGDAAGVVEKSGIIKPLFLSSYTLYERSLNKLIALDADALALPHNTAVKGRTRVRNFLSSSLHETWRLKEKIMADLAESTDFTSIAENILNQEYALSTIMGPREALLINVSAMVKSIYHEFVKIP